MKALCMLSSKAFLHIFSAFHLCSAQENSFLTFSGVIMRNQDHGYLHTKIYGAPVLNHACTTLRKGSYCTVENPEKAGVLQMHRVLHVYI